MHLLICSQCGRPLAARDATDLLLSKLIQLDRFGLGASGVPLLEPVERPARGSGRAPTG